jgi:NitT/TauT family transport system substrate-binding protein
MVFWDNRSLMHLAAGTPDHLRRRCTAPPSKAATRRFSDLSFSDHPSMNRFTAQTAAASAPAAAIALLAGSLRHSAHAEGQIRIAEQFGIVYLLLNVAQEQKLIEKHGKAAGVDAKVEWIKLSGGSAVNDALLSGNIDIAGAGVGPLLTLWDRTKGKQNVKRRGLAGQLSVLPGEQQPEREDDRRLHREGPHRAAGGGRVGAVARAAARLGQALGRQGVQEARQDQVACRTPTRPRPSSAAAPRSRRHFGNPPFQEQELAGNPKAHIVLNSYDVLGGPASATVLYATEKFRNENPKTYKAFVDALDEAAQFVTANPEKAADIYLKVSKAKLDRELLLKIIKNPEVQFKIHAAEHLPAGRVHAPRGRDQEQAGLGEGLLLRRRPEHVGAEATDRHASANTGAPLLLQSTA